MNWIRMDHPGGPDQEKGQDLAEYALLIGAIALLVIATVSVLGINISGLFNIIVDRLPF